MGNIFSFLRSKYNPIQTINCQTDNDRLCKSNHDGFKGITEIHAVKSCIQLVECNKSDLPITVKLPPRNDDYSWINFKSITVPLERISKQKILEYTKKSEQNVINRAQLTDAIVPNSTSKLEKGNGNGSDDSNNRRSLRSHVKKGRNEVLVTPKQKSYSKKQSHKKLIARYCTECRETINSSSMKDSTCCIICETKLLFECLSCNKRSYKSSQGIRYHVMNSCKYRKNTSILQCQNCSKYFTKPFSLQYHIRFCGKKANLVYCAHCSFRTHKKYNLSQHLRTHFEENEELVECYKCGKTLKNKKSLKYHVSHCENDDAYLQCEFCHFKTKHRDSIRTHLQTHHSETTDKGYENIKNKGSLLLQLPQFERYCAECDESVPNANAYRNPMTCHRCGTKYLFHCIQCDQKFKTYAGLLYNLEGTCCPDKIKFRCPKCNHASATRQLLRNHMKKVHNISRPCTKVIPKFYCHHCVYNTFSKKKLRLHVQVHE